MSKNIRKKHYNEHKRKLTENLAGVYAVLLLLLMSGTAYAHQITTTSSISLSPGATVVEGTLVTITGSVAVTGTQHEAPDPIGGKIQIQECTSGGIGVPAANCTSGTAAWINLNGNGEELDVPGENSTVVTFDTSGLAGSIIGFRSHYVTGGGGHAPGQSASPAVDLIITSSCSGVIIGADLASGDGNPVPGASGPWTFRIKVKACEAATGVFAQGGSNGWAPMSGYSPSTGSVNVRQNNKNQVLRWTIGDMTAGQEETLLVTVNSTIPESAACDSIRYLSGPWSATFSTDSGATFQKSEYTGRVSVTVTCPLPS